MTIQQCTAMAPAPSLQLHPDRLLPGDADQLSVARRILAATVDLPIVSPHGHVDPALLRHDEPFSDPAALFVTPDHYVTRLLHADGVPLDALGVGRDGRAGALPEPEARAIWRNLCERWSIFAGTAVRTWLDAELADVFGVEERPSAESADRIFDHIAERLARPEFRPRALYERFAISVLATTDDPCSDLADHEALAADPTWNGRVVPTFRPDRYLEPDRPGWVGDVRRLGESAGVDVGDYRSYVSALEIRRRYFVEHGATSADHSHADVGCGALDRAEAARIFAEALAGRVSDAEAVAFRRHMLGEMARLSCDDGLVMTIHPAVSRNHHAPTFERFGPDTGHDIPLRVDFTEALQPMLRRYGTHPGFHLVLFTLDETTWSRELAPLAGFYPSVFVGVPWWFLDAPDAMRRFRESVTDTIGFTRTSGFVDDTRAFCSIPVRHDTARRIDAGYLAKLVVERRIDEDEAVEVAMGLAGDQARRVFKL